VMAGTREFRLDMARRFGAADTVNIRKEDLAEKISGWFPFGVDAVYECSGTTGGLQSAFDIVRSNGSIVVFSIITERMKEFDPSFLYLKEPIIYGSKGASGMFGEAMKLLEEKKLQILPMITHRFPLEETAKAFKVFSDKVADALRIVIDVRP
jgi:threonine dehydrogenase-like Zn-dependent dehydrogenase